MYIRLTVSWLAALLVVVLVGCGPRVYEISGSVTLDDKPVPDGDILFIPEDPQYGGEPAKIIDGTYRATVREGKKKVEIRASRRVPGKKDPMGTGDDALEDYIPPRYNSESDLSITVGEGKTEHPFAMKSLPSERK